MEAALRKVTQCRTPLARRGLSTADPVLGHPLLITKEMVVKSICKIKNGKASGPSSVVTEMLEHLLIHAVK